MTVVNIGAPVISGQAMQGKTLDTTTGSWTYDEDFISYAYRWLRCDINGANCVAIAGKTSPLLVLAAADVGSRIRSEVTATETSAPPEPPPPPAQWSGPITITAGGTYNGSWESTSTYPAITIETADPVTINGRVRNLAGGYLIKSDFPESQITIDHVFAYGGSTWQNSNRFAWIYNFQSVVISNCTVEHTRGIEMGFEFDGSTILITKNRFNNLLGNEKSPPGNMVQLREVVSCASCEISWNEGVNEPELSSVTDIISLFGAGNVLVADNYFEHQSAPGLVLLSQNGITLESGAFDNQILRNQVIDGAAIAIFDDGGSGNTVHENRIISDGFLPDGVTSMANDYFEPIYIGSSGNHAHDNLIGYIGGQGYQLGRYPGAPEGNLGERANNDYIAEGLIDQQMELDEWTFWVAKKAANGITVGA